MIETKLYARLIIFCNVEICNVEIHKKIKVENRHKLLFKMKKL